MFDTATKGPPTPSLIWAHLPLGVRALIPRRAHGGPIPRLAYTSV